MITTVKEHLLLGRMITENPTKVVQSLFEVWLPIYKLHDLKQITYPLSMFPYLQNGDNHTTQECSPLLMITKTFQCLTASHDFLYTFLNFLAHFQPF